MATTAIIMAAGKGKRMQSDLPKVAHEVAERPMVAWVVDACVEVGCDRVVLVVGHGQEIVRGIFEGWSHPSCELRFAVQDEQLGTGHAVLCTREASMPLEGEAIVLAGDGPLIRAETLRALLDLHRSSGASATLATARLDDPSGYGRIVRDADGRFERIVEQKNASDAELAIDEVNPSYYCFDSAALFGALERVKRDEVSGEYYLTDVPEMLRTSGARVEVIDAVPAEDVLSINTPEHLAEVDGVLRDRLAASGKGPR
ncbi:MAG: NTP transferase domain-containing protein [Planctomycetota bacterium]